MYDPHFADEGVAVTKPRVSTKIRIYTENLRIPHFTSAFGTQTATLYAGGFGPPTIAHSEEYNGTAWTEGNNLTRQRECATTGFGTLWLAPRLPKLYEKYPELKIDLMLEERVLDLPMREADVAIRMKEPSQADLIRKRLMTVNMRLYASPKYLETHGFPKNESDMKNHRLICQNPRSAQVSSGLALVQRLMTQDIPSTLTVNNYFGVLQAVIQDLGIGVLPDYVTQEFDSVIPVLEEVHSNDVPVYLAFPEELRHSKRIEAFRDFVQSEIIEHRRALKAQIID